MAIVLVLRRRLNEGIGKANVEKNKKSEMRYECGIMNQEKFEQWALVELFGHQKIAGKVSNQEIGGAPFIRVDVPKTKKSKKFTKLFGSAAIYSITITDEKTARAAAEYWQPEPMNQWSIESMIQKQLPILEFSESLNAQ